MNRVVLIALVVMSLGACSKGIPTSKLVQYDWSTKMIQVEERWSDGQWYPREPLALDHQFSIKGHAVGEPDFQVRFETDNEKQLNLVLNRKVTVTCADGRQGISHTLDINETQLGWNSTVLCNSHAWRLSVVDSKAVLRPPVAKSGEIIPIVGS